MMAKRKETRAERTDADRRVRQCERFARLMRITRLLLGHGRWGPEDLAREIECSVRTVYRDITTLTMAGIPIHFQKEGRCYKVPEGFRFPGIAAANPQACDFSSEAGELLSAIKEHIRQGEILRTQLERVLSALDRSV